MLRPTMPPRSTLSPSPERGLEPVDGREVNERWTASAHNPWLALVLVLGIGHGAVMNLLLATTPAAYLNAAQLLVLIAIELFSKVRVKVDARALTIHYGHLGWVRQSVALERIESARGSRLEPMEHGGFGYRGSLRFSGRAALVVRAGPGLRLELDGGKSLAISVDDAERGARIINSLLARRSPASPSA